ncbi:hypothetical protein [Serinicoccus profundi]|uniref:hypothetical protein n=1 Tax=Serinicoccus profundi TaxID=1078471 RepID=UPI000255F772|nr:hypothetical protein [Serinicoccus profundi]
MTDGEVLPTLAWGVACLAFVGWGVAAYLGRWSFLRERMLADPEGQRHAGALWLGLLGVPVLALVALPGEGFGAGRVLALVVLGLLLGALCVLVLGRPRGAAGRLTPGWLRRARGCR